jgi:hypothetical protein
MNDLNSPYYWQLAYILLIPVLVVFLRSNLIMRILLALVSILLIIIPNLYQTTIVMFISVGLLIILGISCLISAILNGDEIIM